MCFHFSCLRVAPRDDDDDDDDDGDAGGKASVRVHVWVLFYFSISLMRRFECLGGGSGSVEWKQSAHAFDRLPAPCRVIFPGLGEQQ